MHKCVNNSIGNVYHLEQFVNDFFPYSQKQLGFDKPVTIRFESDEDNASRMLGKTAYYDPTNMEVALYVDGRHPKDVMRSLSHELVHHAQNCRGDFTDSSETYEGYAQADPHLRKMEREAYTKGNLIFRDYEDLIKTGKKDVDIDFTKSGEPKMSLKEWKNNEINTKLMKKWGLLKEDKSKELEHPPEGPGDKGYKERLPKDNPEEELEENAGEGRHPGRGLPPGHRSTMGPGTDEENKKWDEESARIGAQNKANRTPEEEEAQTRFEAQKRLKEFGSGTGYRNDDDSKEHDDEEGNRDPSDDAILGLKEDSEGEETYHYGEAEGHDEKELHDLVKRHATRSHIDALKRDMDYDEDHEDRREHGDHFREGKISVREAKEITRRIIERIRKEGK